MRTSTRSAALAVVLALGLGGCYHATVDTGLRPSGEVVRKDWAHGFLYGLVPPSELDSAAQCPNGVAQVETQLSFLNQLANVLTGGLYTPMTIRVLCAVGPDRTARVIELREATRAELHRSLDEAAARSAETGAPVFVRFTLAE